MAGELENLGKGQVSEMAVDADKGYLVYAVDKKLPDLSPGSPEFAQMRASIAGYMARMSCQLLPGRDRRPGAETDGTVGQVARPRTE